MKTIEDTMWRNFACDFVLFTSVTPVLRSQLNFKYLLYKKVTIHFSIPKTPKLSLLAPYFHSYFIVNFGGMQNRNTVWNNIACRASYKLQSSVANKSCHGQTLIYVLFLTTLPTLKAGHSPYMQYYFKRFCVLHSSEVIFLCLIKKSRQKAIEMETAFCHPLGNPKGRTLDHFFYASHIRHNFPYKLISISMS